MSSADLREDVCAVVRPTPGIASSRSSSDRRPGAVGRSRRRARVRGGDRRHGRANERLDLDLAGQWSTVASSSASRKPWCSSKCPVSASARAAFSVTQAAAGQLGQGDGVALARRPARPASPDRRPRTGRETAGQLDLRVFQDLLHPVLVAGAVLGRTRCGPGQVPQLPDRLGRDERGAQHAALGELGQPHRVELVGLRPARHVLHIPGVDQPAVQAPGFEQVEERLPVRAGGLHHHPLHALADQPVASSRIAFVVEATVQTCWTRRPSLRLVRHAHAHHRRTPWRCRSPRPGPPLRRRGPLCNSSMTCSLVALDAGGAARGPEGKRRS